MNASRFWPGMRKLSAIAFILISGCAFQDKTGSAAKPKSAHNAAASPETPASSPALSPATGASAEQKSAQPASAQEKTADSEALLSIGVGLYEAGDYDGAIRQLQSASRNWKGSKADHVKAVKYIAFSHCLAGRKTLCRRNFVRAMKLDPEFDLDAGEKGHPLWSPEFERAKKSIQTKSDSRATRKK